MQDWTIIQRALYGTLFAVGLGWLAGGLESVVIASRESFLLSGLDFTLLGLAAMLIMGLFAGLVGALVSLPLHFVARSWRPSSAVSVHLSVVGFCLIGFYLWQAAWLVYTDERAPGAAALAAMPLGFAGVIYFNARFLLRRAEIGKRFGGPWLPIAGGAAFGLVLLSAVLFHFRDTGGHHALPDDQNLLLITVGGAAQLPDLPGGARFTNAVTPAPAAGPAAASMLTGIHPLRTTVLFDGDTLQWHYKTLAELLRAEGYATAAFVGQPELAGVGLEQGFLVFDDAMDPFLSGLLRVNLAGHLFSDLSGRRDNPAVVRSFRAWLAQKRDLPFFAWVHLDAPADLPLDDLPEDTLVLAMGTHGPGSGLSEDAVRVPMVLRVPGLKPTVRTVPAQVRLMDTVATAIAFLGIEGPETEGVDLAGYLDGRRSQTLGCTLVGREDGAPVLAVRNNGMKLIETRTGHRLYNIDSDPDQTTDLATVHPDTLEAAKRLLAPDSIRFEQLAPE